MENYFFETDERSTENKVYVLVIYDIINNSKRIKFAKFLQGYGFRIQKSAFEALISHKLYNQLIGKIQTFAGAEDSIRVYKIIGKGQVTCFGKQPESQNEDVIIV